MLLYILRSQVVHQGRLDKSDAGGKESNIPGHNACLATNQSLDFGHNGLRSFNSLSFSHIYNE